MAKKKKLCEICGENPATVPDRERMGRLINRVCSSCHALRLAGDMKLIFELHERRRQAQLGHNAKVSGAGTASAGLPGSAAWAYNYERTET